MGVHLSEKREKNHFRFRVGSRLMWLDNYIHKEKEVDFTSDIRNLKESI